MSPTQLATAAGANSVGAISASATAWSLIDCHAAEHLLIGTHSLDDTAEPVCVTCQVDSTSRR